MGKIIKSVEHLQPLSEPPGGNLIGRDRDVDLLKDLIRNNARNIFVYGGPGTGKTSCIKRLLKKLEEEDDSFQDDHTKLKTIYVNSGQTRSPYYTFLEILQDLGVNAPDSGWQMNKVKQIFETARGSRRLVIAIDEVDALLRKEREPLVYYLSRQPGITLIMVTNQVGEFRSLPARAKSGLQAIPYEFDSYSSEEVKAILKARLDEDFQPGTVSEEAISAIANFVVQNQDIRIGFNILVSAAFIAERQGKDHVDKESLLTAGDIVGFTLQ